MSRRFVGKAFALGALALLLQAAGANLVFRMRGFPAREALDRALENRADLVLFGDSVFRRKSADDRDSRDLVAMLSDQLPPPIGVVDHPGYGMEVYESFVEYVARQPHRPRRMAFAINLRSFSPEWDRAPGWQFERQKRRNRWGDLVALTLMKPLSTFGVIRRSSISQDEYENTPVWQGDRPVGVLRDYQGPAFEIVSEDHIRKKMICRYLYGLAAEHRKVQSMMRIVELCEKHGMKASFYITPVDVESGDRSVGPEFGKQVAANARVLVDRLAARNVAVADFSRLLGASEFCWREEGYPSEHLKDRGRERLAREIVRFVDPK
jgi:hypothetical protein